MSSAFSSTTLLLATVLVAGAPRSGAQSSRASGSSSAQTGIPVGECQTIHGRAHYYCGDANLRIWQIGTHHEFEPDESSFDAVIQWLEAGVKESAKTSYACPVGTVDLYADFLICPTEPLKEGAVQHAIFKSASHRRYKTE